MPLHSWSRARFSASSILSRRFGFKVSSDPANRGVTTSVVIYLSIVVVPIIQACDWYFIGDHGDWASKIIAAGPAVVFPSSPKRAISIRSKSLVSGGL